MTSSIDVDFTEFVALSSARLFRTAYAVCGDHQLAEDALQAGGPDAVYYGTQMRGASNAKAKRELGFQPRALEWIS